MKNRELKKIDIDFDSWSIDGFHYNSSFYDEEAKRTVSYWTDGERIYWKYYILEGADLDSFVVYNNTFAKDKKYCYLYCRKLRSVDVLTFKALNQCYAKDKNYAWTTGGIIKDIDSETFEVCDDGFHKPFRFYEQRFSDGSVKLYHRDTNPRGYAKDINNVYYENFQGKIKILRKANPKTFKSLNIGDFGYDDKFVYWAYRRIQKADLKSWKKIASDDTYYSMDHKSVFYLSRQIKEADVHSFEVISLKSKEGYTYIFGKDRNNYYENGVLMDLKEIKAFYDIE